MTPLVCPGVSCGELSPPDATHCVSCGKGLFPTDAPIMRRRRCIYCGRMTQGRTCPAHRGLPAKDPQYAEARL